MIRAQSHCRVFQQPAVLFPKNKIEKFNVEPGGRTVGAAKIRREIQRSASISLPPHRNARPLDKDL
jgi:hypothetical protein